jgi:hypothetical protein
MRLMMNNLYSNEELEKSSYDFIISKLYNERIIRLKENIKLNNNFKTLWKKDLINIVNMKNQITELCDYIIAKNPDVFIEFNNIQEQIEKGGLITQKGLINILSKNHYKIIMSYIRQKNSEEYLKNKQIKQLELEDKKKLQEFLKAIEELEE